MTKIESIHPVLMCHDVAASLCFYERLGFVLIFKDDIASPKYAVVRRDGVELHLQWADQSQWSFGTDRPVYRFLVSDPDTFYAELMASGMLGEHAHSDSPWRTPGNTPWHTREFHILDPGDNALQFYRPR